MTLSLALVGFVLCSAPSTSTQSASPPSALSLFVGAGVLASTGAVGAQVSGGVRWRTRRNLAVELDTGYGLLDGSNEKQDRWWLIPSVAYVLPLARVELELGGGLGLGICSGYPSWAAYFAAPFSPPWAFQLVPTARAQLVPSLPLSAKTSVYSRLEVAALLLGGNGLGFRDHNPNPQLSQTTWASLSFGVRFDVL